VWAVNNRTKMFNTVCFLFKKPFLNQKNQIKNNTGSKKLDAKKPVSFSITLYKIIYI
jgi:hypothetical protein